ncbi:hypothetical protein AB0M46_13895, partial [Dactylosporangium sp. NPDC051485]|uniref:hypothetical protein n=1 Tax=Dactylosporangium sp. NPDC051485 TaxID=3154846 RepID=UPI003447ED58
YGEPVPVSAHTGLGEPVPVSAHTGLGEPVPVSAHTGLGEPVPVSAEPPVSVPFAACGLDGAGGSADDVSKGRPAPVEINAAVAASRQDRPSEATGGSLIGGAVAGERDETATERTTGDERSVAYRAGDNATQRAAMWAYWEECRMHRRALTGADLDRKFGTNNYGRRVINDWVRQGRVTEAEVAAARSGWLAEAA